MNISQQQLLNQLNNLTSLPRPVLGQVISLPNQAIGSPHRHPWAQLSYAISGVLTVNTAAGQFVAPPNRAILVPAGIEHGVHCAADTVIRSLYIAADQVPERHCKVLHIDALLKELIMETQFQILHVILFSQGRNLSPRI